MIEATNQKNKQKEYTKSMASKLHFFDPQSGSALGRSDHIWRGKLLNLRSAKRDLAPIWHSYWRSPFLSENHGGDLKLIGGLEHFLFSPIVGMMIQSD